MEVDLIRQFIDIQLPNLNWLWCRCQNKSHFTSPLPSLLFANVLCFKTTLEQHSMFIFQGSFIFKVTVAAHCTQSGTLVLQRYFQVAEQFRSERSPGDSSVCSRRWPRAAGRGHRGQGSVGSTGPAQPGLGGRVLGVAASEPGLLRAAAR